MTLQRFVPTMCIHTTTVSLLLTGPDDSRSSSLDVLMIREKGSDEH